MQILYTVQRNRDADVHRQCPKKFRRGSSNLKELQQGWKVISFKLETWLECAGELDLHPWPWRPLRLVLQAEA